MQLATLVLSAVALLLAIPPAVVAWRDLSPRLGYGRLVLLANDALTLVGALGGSAIVGSLGFGGLVYVTRRQAAHARRAELLAAVGEFAALADECSLRLSRTTTQVVIHGRGRDADDLGREFTAANARLGFVEPASLTTARLALNQQILDWEKSPGPRGTDAYIEVRQHFTHMARNALET